MIPSFSLLLAWRDGRAELRRHLFHLAAVAVGVAALVALSSLSAGVEDGVRSEGRSLLGGDVRISSSLPFPERTLQVVDSLGSLGVENARSTTFGTMVLVPESGTSRFLQVRAVSEGYPLYGTVRDEPTGSWDRLGDGRVLVDPQTLDQLGVRVGDSIRFGGVEGRVEGVVEGLPPETGFRAAVGGAIYASARDVDEAGLLEAGSVAQRRIDLRVREGTNGSVLAGDLRRLLRDDLVSIRSAEERAEGLIEGIRFVGGFLGLVGFTALLLGGIGVGSAAHAHLEEKVSTIAVLRCLGARERDVFAAFLLQAAGLALLGTVAGVLIGLAAQWGAVEGLRSAFGLDLTAGLHLEAVAAGFALGLWFSFLFSAVPLAGIRGIPPLHVFRRGLEGRETFRPLLGVLLAAASSLVAGALWTAPSVGVGLAYVGGLLVVCALLLALARLLVWTIRRLLPPEASFALRQGLAGLFRPRNQTGTVVLALGFGTFLLATVTVLERSLLERIAVEETAGGSNLILFDIREDQREEVAGLVIRVTGDRPAFHPIVPARISEIRGRTVSELLGDPEAGIPGWTLRRIYRNTYRSELQPAEELVGGRWWGAKGDRIGENAYGGAEAARVSVEEDLAMELGIRLGDRIVWDVQGVPIPSRVASVRRVNWARFEPNFFVVFEPGALEAAPQTFLVALHVPARADRSEIQALVTEDLPGIAVLDFAQVRETVDRVIARVGWGVRGLSAFTLLAGIFVLVGVLVAYRRRKIREIALLRALGARRRTLLAYLGTEYAVIGSVAGFAGVVLGVGAAALLLRFQFDLPVSVPPARLVGLWLGATGLSVGAGVAGARSLLRIPPLPVLRREEA